MQLHYHASMRTTLETESTLTDRYQTTIPETVRRALRLGKRDRIRFAIQADGRVLLSRADQSAASDDPALGPFLALLARDITEHPERLRAVDPGLPERIRSLVGSDDVDLDAPLSADDE